VDTVAVAVAPEPPPPLKVTSGGEEVLYPVPPEVTLIDAMGYVVTVAPLMLASAAAPDPPPPLKVTVGADVYPAPGLVIVTDATG